MPPGGAAEPQPFPTASPIEAGAFPAAATNVRPGGGFGKCAPRISSGSAAATAALKLSSSNACIVGASLMGGAAILAVSPIVISQWLGRLHEKRRLFNKKPG